MILFVWSFVVSLAISLVTTFWVQTTAVARGLLVPPASDRHLHTKPLPRIGGVGIYLAFLITVVCLLCRTQMGATNLCSAHADRLSGGHVLDFPRGRIRRSKISPAPNQAPL